MKYIKHFESKQDLQEFCETNLAYLLDDHEFEVEVRDDMYGKQFSKINYIIHIRRSKLGSSFKWVDVKEQIIPFLHNLNREFNIYKNLIDFHFVAYESNSFNIDSIISEKLPYRYINKESQKPCIFSALYSLSIKIL